MDPTAKSLSLQGSRQLPGSARSAAMQPAGLTHTTHSLMPATKTGRNRSASLRVRSGAAPEGAAQMQSRRSARRSTRNFSPGTGPAWQQSCAHPQLCNSQAWPVRRSHIALLRREGMRPPPGACQHGIGHTTLQA